MHRKQNRLMKKHSKQTRRNRPSIGTRMDRKNLRKSLQKLNSSPKSTPNKGFPAFPCSEDCKLSVFFFFWKLRIIMRGQNDHFVPLLQRTADDLLKNRFHSSLVGQIVIQDIEEGFRHSLTGKIKKLTSV